MLSRIFILYNYIFRCDGNKYGRYRELIDKDTSRSLSEDEELVDLIKYFQSIPFFVAEDIILDFQITESQRKHGKNK